MSRTPELNGPRLAYVYQSRFSHKIRGNALNFLDTIAGLATTELPGEVVRIEGLTYADFAPAPEEDA